MGKRVFIAGLGNPGESYRLHRHNLGFMVVDELCRLEGGDWRKTRPKALISRIDLAGIEAVLVKPQTYMNLSGTAVAPLVKRFNVDPHDLIVVHDDLDLTPGKVRIKRGGGDGGHRGVRSIADSLRFKDFLRVRVGIGRPPEGMTAERYVLTPFPRQETGLMEKWVERAVLAVRLLVSEGFEQARNTVHSLPMEVQEPAP